AVVARVGEPLPDSHGWVLLLDRADRPLGWVRADRLRSAPVKADDVDASSPLVHLETTLRDALAMLLASAVQTAVVVDERGRYSGVLTLDALGAAFRESPSHEPAGVT